MPRGLETFNAAGQRIFFGERISRVVGITTISADDTISDGGLTGGAVWYALMPAQEASNISNAMLPTVVINGASITVTGVRRVFYLIYGVY